MNTATLPAPDVVAEPKPTTFELIGPLQARIMHALWSNGASTVHEMADRLNEPGRQLAYTTYLTVLRNLARRGLVDQVAAGRSHRFAPLVTREAYYAQLVSYLRETYFRNNNVELLLAIESAKG